MMFKKIVAVLALSTVTVLPSLAWGASPAAAAQCILSGHRVTAVRPLHITERYARGASERLVGAQVFVQAEPGLTGEWLQLTIQRHMAQMNGQGMGDCPLDAKDISVSVQSVGPGFVVKIAGKGTPQATEILRRAQLLIG